MMLDLTKDRLVEQELRDLGARLIGAHEQERMRFARELHDDLMQRVALLAAELGVLRQRVTEGPWDIRDAVARISAETADIGSELHRLSHDLHPGRLKQLGLQASIRCFCADFARAHHITLDVKVADMPEELEMDVTLSLYRITQEALSNVVKHSRATRATVTLTSPPAEVVLWIADNGIGFDPAALPRTDSLGLVSMRERARFIQAHLLVSSTPGEGTVIEVRVPGGYSR